MVASSNSATCRDSQCTDHNYSNTTFSCAKANGTVLVAGKQGHTWTVLCDMDYTGQDIYPFILATSYGECLEHCDRYNQKASRDPCVGFIFAPGRSHMADDCYLKMSLKDPLHHPKERLIGAKLEKGVATSSQSVVQPKPSAGLVYGDILLNMKPKLLGTSVDTAVKQYVSHVPALPAKLGAKLLKPGINLDLVTKYPLAANTGSWTESTAPLDIELTNLTINPRLSRDGGKGGTINGTHIFFFCDTSTFGEEQGPLGYMNGFVSSSAAMDVTRKALDNKALELTNPIGQWQDDVGRLRGWIPLTEGEESFNIATSGDGYRYAVWPESSLIPVNQTHSAVYAPIVYVQVDMKTQHADFTSLGNTLVLVSVDPTYGPHADRVVKQMFKADQVEWGSLGGVRAWTKAGPGSNDGETFLLGQGDGGILLAKVSTSKISDVLSYTYWNGTSWDIVPPNKKSSQAFMLNQSVMDIDIFYAAAYKCFIMIYLTPFADNTFYIRTLNVTNGILAPYMPGGSEDYAYNLVRSKWSEPRVLWKPPVPAEGFIYAAGCHLGYFGDDDISNGGVKLLMTWTEHTAVDPNNPASGYAHKSVVFGSHAD